MIEPTRGDTAPAIHVPNGAVTAATKPIISAAFTCTSLRFRFATLVVIEAAAVDGANSRQTLFNVTIPLMMPSITVCTFLTVTNGFKMFDQNLALTNGAPSNSSELLALNIYRTFYGRAGFEGVGQAKAVVFFIIVAVIALIQNKLTTSKEVQA